MTQNDRIDALEARVSDMQAAYQKAADLMQHLGGSERVFQAAVLTMIAKFPNRESLRPLLLECVERASTAVLFDAQSEAHQQGAQEARELILAFLDNK